MKAKQFAWTHVISKGKMNMRPAYYGGWEMVEKIPTGRYDDPKQQEKQKQFLDDIKKYGVNWDKTDNIQSETYSEFAGTFAESQDSSVYLEGWITLKNGAKAFWCAENIDASDVFGMMENMSALNEKYTEIFGE